MFLILAIAVIMLIGAHIAVPICSAIVFAWCVDFHRSVWTPRDYAVAALLATCGLWSTLAVLAAVLAGTLAPVTPIGEFYRRGIYAGVLVACLAPLALLGGAAIGRVREGVAIVGVLGLAVFLAASLPVWLGGFASALIVWDAAVLCLLILDAGLARRAYERIGACPICGYSLLGLATASCPECGNALHCVCGYNMAGHRVDSPCPECGRAAGEAALAVGSV